MVEDQIVVEDAVLILGTSGPDLYKQNVPYRLYHLPAGSTLYVDLQHVEYMDDKYAFDSVGLLQCGLSVGPLKDKHLILLNPRPAVLKSIEKAVDDLGEAFLYMDERGIMHVGGKAFIPSFRRALLAVLQSEEALTSAKLSEILEIPSLQVCARLLKQLYGWGLVCRSEVPSGQPGRPVVKYSAYWPADSRWWPTAAIAWEVPSSETTQSPVLVQRDASELLRTA